LRRRQPAGLAFRPDQGVATDHTGRDERLELLRADGGGLAFRIGVEPSSHGGFSKCWGEETAHERKRERNATGGFFRGIGPPPPSTARRHRDEKNPDVKNAARSASSAPPPLCIVPSCRRPPPPPRPRPRPRPRLPIGGWCGASSRWP